MPLYELLQSKIMQNLSGVQKITHINSVADENIKDSLNILSLCSTPINGETTKCKLNSNLKT